MQFNFINGPEGPNNRNGNRGRITISIKNFFEGDGNVGYIKKETFRDLMSQLKVDAPALLKNYHNFFNCLKDGFLISNTLHKQTHRTNQSDYYHLKFTKGMMQVPVTFYLVENFSNLLNDYAYGKIDFNCSLEELLEEANN